MYPPEVIIRGDAAVDWLTSAELLFTLEQQEQVLTNCMPQLTVVYGSSPEKLDIGNGYLRYLQSSLKFLKAYKTKRGETGVMSIASRKEPTVTQRVEAVETPTIPGADTRPPPIPTRPPPIPARPPQVPDPTSALARSSKEPEGLNSLKTEGIETEEEGNITTPTPEERCTETKVDIIEHGNRSPSASAKPDDSAVHASSQVREEIHEDSFEEKVADFLAITAFFGDTELYPCERTIYEFCKLCPELPSELVLRYLGIWLCSSMQFSRRSVEDPTTFIHLPVSSLITLCDAVPPAVEWEGQDEGSHIFSKTDLNGDRLVNLAGIRLVRTRSIGLHLHFDKRARTLFLFATAGFTWSNNNYQRDAGLPPALGLKREFTEELSRTFSLLFDCSPASRRVFHKFQISEPDLKPLMPPLRKRRHAISDLWTSENPIYSSRSRSWALNHGNKLVLSAIDQMRDRNKYVYKITNFRRFGRRLLILETFLGEMKPATWRDLLKDSRDQLQYYTFMIAVVVFFMTAVGLVLTLLQTIASFLQVFKG
ncbi:hypothetical protein EV426DRAFT_429209 [Tirmania nivea]|nr:hypothetical protein EV426DRAFT_429209 [Tirmania nivea]